MPLRRFLLSLKNQPILKSACTRLQCSQLPQDTHTMPVSTQHPQYAAMLPIWRATRAATAGQAAIKLGRTDYLPASFAKTEPEVYEEFLQRAFWLDVTGRTQAALVGMVFSKRPTIKMPDAMTPLVENIDGQGQSLEQLGKELIENALQAGRHILLSDYPQIDGVLDRESEQSMGLRPTIASYPAESLINWRVEGINGQQKITLAVLMEYRRDPNIIDDFSHGDEKVYRVLRLRNGVYTQSLYDEDGTVIVNEYTPRMAGGAAFDYIPIHIIGSDNNKPNCDMPPLSGLASVNVSHYQTTANIEETGWLLGQPMLSIDVGDSEDLPNWQQLNGGTEDEPPKFKFGSRFSYVSKRGKAEIVQVSDTDYNVNLAARKEEQMIMLGARLVQRGGQAETAEASRINASAEASTLETLVGNASEAIEAALEDCALFMGTDPAQVEFSLNRTFWETALNAQDYSAVVQSWRDRMISQGVALHMVRTGSIRLPDDLTNDEIIEQTGGELLPMDDQGLTNG